MTTLRCRQRGLHLEISTPACKSSFRCWTRWQRTGKDCGNSSTIWMRKLSCRTTRCRISMGFSACLTATTRSARSTRRVTGLRRCSCSTHPSAALCHLPGFLICRMRSRRRTRRTTIGKLRRRSWLAIGKIWIWSCCMPAFWNRFRPKSRAHFALKCPGAARRRSFARCWIAPCRRTTSCHLLATAPQFFTFAIPKVKQMMRTLMCFGRRSSLKGRWASSLRSKKARFRFWRGRARQTPTTQRLRVLNWSSWRCLLC
mmetsp:Transcript_64857/g.154831  ORF Transcript_64857/g.154831 Transcript_64857/m.154831 type:complete len:257 (+) Transcript_64857:343-1113(+)